MTFSDNERAALRRSLGAGGFHLLEEQPSGESCYQQCSDSGENHSVLTPGAMPGA